jgi:ribonuclease III
MRRIKKVRVIKNIPMLKELYDYLNYTFRDVKLLEEALTHPSASKKWKNGIKFNYERLEFLGDSILASVMAEYLIKNHEFEREGDLSDRKAFLVSSKIIYRIAREKIFLDRFIIMSDGEKNSGGATKISNLENCMEAIIGAIFLDSDFDTVRNIVLNLWLNLDSSFEKAPRSSKMKLQEWSQKHLKILPRYITVEEINGKNTNIFTMRVELENFKTLETSGGSKKETEEELARMMLEYIGSEKERVL